MKLFVDSLACLTLRYKRVAVEVVLGLSELLRFNSSSCARAIEATTLAVCEDRLAWNVALKLVMETASFAPTYLIFELTSSCVKQMEHESESVLGSNEETAKDAVEILEHIVKQTRPKGKDSLVPELCDQASGRGLTSCMIEKLQVWCQRGPLGHP